MSWFLAPSLRALFAEVNQVAPGRNKRSDGSVGDTSHQARLSDHNPDNTAGGVVRAIDLTHDPGGGCDCNQLVTRVREGRDPRVAYVIWNRRIMSGQGGPGPWIWPPCATTMSSWTPGWTSSGQRRAEWTNEGHLVRPGFATHRCWLRLLWPPRHAGGARG